MSSGKAIGTAVPLAVVGQEACVSTDLTSVFGETAIGTTDTKTITITNCGDVNETYSVASTGSDYTVVSQPTGTVSPTGTVTFTVSYHPTTCGASAGGITVTPLVAGTAPVTVNGSGVGTQLAVTGNAKIMAEDNQPKDMTLTVKNNSAFPWIPGASTLSGPFTVVDMQPQGPLAPGAEATVTIRYTPTKFGTETGTLAVVGSPMECSQTVLTFSGENAVSAGVRTVAEKSGYRLEQNYPNPFNPTTEIKFTMPTTAEVKLVILDMKGEVVRTVLNEKLGKGDHKVTVNASDLASGTYFYQLTSGNVTLIRSMMLVK
jgi:hypothetical protein